MSTMYSVTSGHDSLTGLGQNLAAVLECPEGHSIGAFASLVGRLHAELSMMGDQAAQADDEDVLFESLIDSLDECRLGC